MIFGDTGFSKTRQIFAALALAAFIAGGGATAVAGGTHSESSESFTFPEPFYVKTQKSEISPGDSSGKILTTKMDFRFGRSAGEGKAHTDRTGQTVTTSKAGDTLVVSGLFSEGDGPSTLRITPVSPYDGNASLVKLRIEILNSSGELLSAPSITVKLGEKASFVEKFSSNSGGERVLAVDVVVGAE